MSVVNLNAFPHTVGNLDDRPNLAADDMKAAFEKDCMDLWDKVREVIPDLNAKLPASDIVKIINSTSTDAKVPSAKAVYDAIADALLGAGGTIAEAIITDWLDDHPEATTTVADGAVTNAKLNSAFVSPGVALEYSTSETYKAGQYVFRNKTLYRCISDINTAESWTAAHWKEVPLGSDVYELMNVVEGDVFDWDSIGTSLSPLGWRSGYYSSADGTYSGSEYYICTATNELTFDKTVAYIAVDAPSGYSARIYEYNGSGTLLKIYGKIQSGPQHVSAPVDPDHKYGIALGKFNSLDASDHLTDAFLSTVVMTLYSPKIADQVKDVQRYIDSLFYFDNISIPVASWRTGYYSSITGEYADSTLYICTGADVYVQRNNGAFLVLEAPEDCFIAANEYTSAGEYVQRHGSPKNTRSLEIPIQEGRKFRITVGRFSDYSAASKLTTDFVSKIKIKILEPKASSSNGKLDRTGSYEWFTVKVPRPLSFGGEEVIDPSEEQEVECVLRLPESYTRSGAPTRLVLACHGSSGYISSSAVKWYNANWTDFMNALLSAGYAVFDSNIFPTTTGTEKMGYSVGSPLYVNVLKKAYDYITDNYNVYHQIFAHGTSMGGVGASAFVNAYPELVLAESSFAGRDITQYLWQLHEETGVAEEANFAAAFGYASQSALASDHFSHVVGVCPSLSLLKYSDGALVYPPDREASYADWLSYYGEIQSHSQADTIGQYTAKRTVPYKTWDSWADNEHYTKAKLILQKAFANGNSAPYLCVIYDNATHTDLCYGQGDYIGMRSQLIAWYKRWE